MGTYQSSIISQIVHYRNAIGNKTCLMLKLHETFRTHSDLIRFVLFVQFCCFVCVQLLNIVSLMTKRKENGENWLISAPYSISRKTYWIKCWNCSDPLPWWCISFREFSLILFVYMSPEIVVQPIVIIVWHLSKIMSTEIIRDFTSRTPVINAIRATANIVCN